MVLGSDFVPSECEPSCAPPVSVPPTALDMENRRRLLASGGRIQPAKLDKCPRVATMVCRSAAGGPLFPFLVT
ncbi:hypothetical protein I79_026112 [Cricetulus griseus]|uniref:Uncharacterized protein n=1 Tax=Cricetulus griseus TaxID=10029 RepID=G3IQ24_CRIGR|nr:hypothetical protein I79_026112 [Cricetulus griseus]